MELFFMLKKCSFKFLPPRNWNQSVLHVVTLEQGLKDLAGAQGVHVRGHEEKDPLALHLLVELPAEIGHEHGHGDGTPGARSPGHTKPPRWSRLPPNHGSSDWPRGQPIAT